MGMYKFLSEVPRDAFGVVYGIIDVAQPGFIQYVGLAKNLPKRISSHWYGAKSDVDRPVCNWLRERLHDRKSVRFEILDFANDRQELNDKEVYWIARVREAGQAPLNIQPGGFNNWEFVPDQELRAKWSSQRRYGGVSSATLDEESVLEIRRMVASGMKYKEIATATGYGIQAIGHVARGESWGYIPWEPGTAPRVNLKYTGILTPEAIEDMFKMASEGIAIVDICKKHSRTRSRVTKVLKGYPELREKYDLDNPDVIEARKAAKYELIRDSLRGSKSPWAVIDEDQVRRIRYLVWRGVPYPIISEHTGVRQGNVNNIANGKSWDAVPWPIGPRPKMHKRPSKRGDYDHILFDPALE